MNRLLKFLLGAVGVDDPAVLDPKVPRDALHRAATVGLAMLATAFFAFVAATASALMVLHDHPWRFVLASGFGLLWAIAIFAIDRALVLSMARIKWPALALRLFLAVIISISISVPLDIWLFGDRVEEQLLKIRQHAEIDSRARLNQLHGVEIAREQTAAAQAELQRLDQATQTWPPQVRDAQQQAKLCEANFERVRARTQRQVAEVDAKRADVQHRLDLLAGVNPRPAERISALTQQRKALWTQRERFEADVHEARKGCDAVQVAVQTVQRQHLEQIEVQQKDARAVLLEARKSEQHLTQAVSEKSAEASRVISKAMSDNFVVKAEALHQLVAESPFVRSVYLLVLILWITLEMAPVLTKSMAGESAIDLVLEAKSRELELTHLDRIERQEDEVLMRRDIREALREQLPAFIRENPDTLRSVFDARMTAQGVLTPHNELLGEFEALLERTQVQRDRIKHAGFDEVLRRDLLDAVARLERAAADSVHAAFVDVLKSPSAS